MERLKRTLLVLALLPLVLATGCGSVVQVNVATKTATPAPPAPSPTLASVELTSTHTPPPGPPTATPEPPTSTPEPPTATPEPPTATPEPGPTRIQFEPGATSATLTGRIERTGESGVESGAGYVLRALAGQTMEVVITSPNGDVLLSIVGADGIPLKRSVDDRADWRGVLPATQDYFIKPVSVGADTGYVLTVTVSPLEPQPTRIQFEPGATSATLTGRIERTEEDGVEFGARYVLRALAGQTMEVVITSPNGDVLLSIVGADGIPLKRYVDDRADWRGVLYATQDYFIRPVSVGADTSYVLTVTISPLEPQPTRIQFEPGATSAVVEEYLEPGLPDRYVLRALRGQRMDVRVSLAETVDIVVEGQDGSSWSAVASEGILRIGELPATQDYIITLALPVPVAGAVGYAMEVSVY